MFLCDQWRDYEVLDTGDGEKLERWGDIVLRRPDPQVIWPKADPALWDAAQATYVRSDTGGGHWEFREKLPERWVISLNNLKFYVKPTASSIRGCSRSRRPTGPSCRSASAARARGAIRRACSTSSPTRAGPRWPAPPPARTSPMWTRLRAWCSGRAKTAT